MAKLKLGTIELKTNLQGIDLTLPTDLSIQIETETDKVIFNTESLIDLGQVQSNFFTIIKNSPVPPIDGYGTKVEITSFDNATLIPNGDSAILEISASCTAWQISKGLPSITVREECVDVLLGKICYPVKIETGNGSDIKLKLFSEGFSAKLKFGLTTPDNKSIDIVQLDTEVYPRGELGKFINWILSFVKGDLNHFATGKLRDLINEGTIRQTLPTNLNTYNPSIKTIQFVTLTNGNLGVLANLEAVLTEEQLGEIITKSIG